MLQELFNTVRLSGNPILEGAFSDVEDVFSQFTVSESEREGVEIIFANYECECYEGSASVYFFDRNTEKYYEVYGGHCSCYGLEGQWQPEEICFPELEKRFNGSFFGTKY